VGGLDSFPHAFVVTDLAEVFANLLGRGEEVCPVVLGLPRELVVVARDIASASRVAVLEPGAAHVGVLLVYHELVVGQVEPQGADHVQATRSGADANDADVPGRAKRLFLDRVDILGSHDGPLGFACRTAVIVAIARHFEDHCEGGEGSKRIEREYIEGSSKNGGPFSTKEQVTDGSSLVLGMVHFTCPFNSNSLLGKQPL